MTNRVSAALAAGALFISVSAVAQSDDAQIARGRLLVQNNCAMCHAIGRYGDSPNGLAPRFRELHKRYPVENLGEALAEGIIVGHPQMPQFRFSAQEVSDIIAYLESIQMHRHARASKRDAGRG